MLDFPSECNSSASALEKKESKPRFALSLWLQLRDSSSCLVLPQCTPSRNSSRGKVTFPDASPSMDGNFQGVFFPPWSDNQCARVLQTLPGFPCSILCARLVVHMIVACHFWHVHDAPGLHQPFGGKGKPLKLRGGDQIETCRGLGIYKGNSQETVPEPKVILKKNRSKHDLSGKKGLLLFAFPSI